MNEEAISEGVKLFARNSIAFLNVERESDFAYEVKFHGDPDSAFIDIAGFGGAISYTMPCQILQGTQLAPALLLKNWGSIDSSGLYFSVHEQDGQPWLFVETLQFLGANATPGQVASILGTCSVGCRSAKETIESMLQEGAAARSASCRICNERVQIHNVPLDVAMVVYEGRAPLICRRCVIQEGIPIERLGPQEKILFRGDKYLGYDDSFVLI